MAGEEVFDRVESQGPDGARRTWTRAEFAALPITQRVQVLLHQKPVFYKGTVVVAAREAVRSL